MPPLLGSSALKAEPSPKCWYHPQGWQEPVPPQLLEGAPTGSMLTFLTVPESFCRSVSVLGSSLLTWRLSVLRVPLCCLGHWLPEP